MKKIHSILDDVNFLFLNDASITRHEMNSNALLIRLTSKKKVTIEKQRPNEKIVLLDEVFSRIKLSTSCLTEKINDISYTHLIYKYN